MTVRGTCARVARAIYGQQAGAVAVVMINTSNAFPPFEGQITSNPDTGVPYTVTIPFLGVKGVLGPALSDDGDLLIQATTAVSTTATTVTNTTYQQITSFSSGGPRNVDSAAKPDLAAPGQSVVSTGVGTGNGAATISGTSMAAPMTSGAAALMTEAHPDWSTERIKGAMVNTTKSPLPSLNVRTAGSGVLQIDKAIDSKVIATTIPEGTSALSFGYEPLSAAYSETLTLKLRNTGSSPVTYNLSATGASLGLNIAFNPSSGDRAGELASPCAGDGFDVRGRRGGPAGHEHVHDRLGRCPDDSRPGARDPDDVGSRDLPAARAVAARPARSLERGRGCEDPVPEGPGKHVQLAP